ncbi:MAG: cell wall metabolism sensor histidine kinase WalK [Epulopiscium sp.]|nr:cell wall metabolism sensor histidine kinase WalK [Candidatus Epulonipiscium sp.]
MKSIKWKLVVMNVLLVMMVMIISGTFIVFSVRSKAYQDLQDSFNHAVGQLRQVVSLESSKTGMEEALKSAIINSAYFYKDTQIYLLNGRGETIFSTVSREKEKPHVFSQSVLAAMNGKQSKEMDRLVEEDDTLGPIRMRGYAGPIMMDGEVAFIIHVRRSTKDLEMDLLNTIFIIFVALFLAIILMAAIGWILAKTLTQPIITLTQKARQMAEGDLKQVIRVQSDDEIGQLTINFNRMAFELNRVLSEIISEKNKVETILSHMADGVLTFNRKGYLIHGNQLAYQLLSISKGIKKIDELFEWLEIPIDYEELITIGTGNIIQRLLKIQDKYINACFAPYLDQRQEPAGVIIVFQDVTEHKKLEEAQKEFVANVSHELRTPLTTIKSYTETLLDGALEDTQMANTFLKVVDQETDRMTILVKDLLELSKLDSKQIHLERKMFLLIPLLENCIEKYSIYLQKKKQQLYFEPPEKEYEIFGDPNRIAQVINNVLGNAIKYSPEKATITISITEEKAYVVVSIQDTGLGIPQEDLKNIFKRFYRVDKARSRALGGTGLGLAITKEIMELHGGEIKIQSVYEKGTTVQLYFLKVQ